jgi:Transposase IS116/IS110/IS902 family
VRAFADSLGPTDEVALEVTGNTWAIATLLASRAGRVVVSNPAKTRAIAEAKVKTDKVDSAILAGLLLRQLDFHAEELHLIDRDLGRVALDRDDVWRLMSIPGVDATVALSIVAAVGDFTRFRTPEKLVCYFGLNPRVRQSGGQPASHGRITKAGPGHARGMLVEGAWAASKAPGPLRAFYQRVRARRGMQVAAVATARKLAVLCWHLMIKGEDYAFALPSLVAHKRRKLELRAGLPAHRGQKGRSASYSLKAVRAAERELAGQAETAYRTMVAAWQPTPTRRQRFGAEEDGGGRGRQQWDATLKPSGYATRQHSQSQHAALRSAVDHAHHRQTLPRSSPRSRSFLQPGAPP